TRIRRKVDPEEVVQSAFKSFFLRHGAGQYELTDWNSLWSLLVSITLKKCGHRVEHYRAACRDVARESSPLGSDDSIQSFQLLADDPSPSQATFLAELAEEIAASLNDDRERQIFALSLEGQKPAQISKRIGRTERTVQRVLN